MKVRDWTLKIEEVEVGFLVVDDEYFMVLEGEGKGMGREGK